MVVGRVAAVVGVNQLQERRRIYRRYGARRPKRPTKEELDDADLGFNEAHTWVSVLMRRVARSTIFQWAILIFVILGSVIVGASTYGVNETPPLSVWMTLLDEVVVGVFVAEVVVKVLSEGRRPLEYFRDRWNMLDFAIAALSLIPLRSDVGTDRGRASDSTQAVVVLRIVRLLRVLKLMRILPKLRILVLGLLSSLSSIAYIGLMLLLLFYLYAVLGTTAFGENDPVFFGSLHVSMLTLFRVATLEDWSDCMYIQIYGCAHYYEPSFRAECTSSKPSPTLAVVYFVSFVVFSGFMILNMLVGVIMSSLEEARKYLTDEFNAAEARKVEERRVAALPAFLQRHGHLSFVGSFVDKPSEFDEQAEATERLVELRDLVAKIADEAHYIRTVELDRWVRQEEYRVQENLRKVRKVKQLARGVTAMQQASRLAGRGRRRGSVASLLSPSGGAALQALDALGAKGQRRGRRASVAAVSTLMRMSSAGEGSPPGGNGSPPSGSPKRGPAIWRRLSQFSTRSQSLDSAASDGSGGDGTHPDAAGAAVGGAAPTTAPAAASQWRPGAGDARAKGASAGGKGAMSPPPSPR